jgi:hypothetical protein
MEKLYRDAKIYELCRCVLTTGVYVLTRSDEGTSQIQRMIVSRQLKDIYPA